MELLLPENPAARRSHPRRYSASMDANALISRMSHMPATVTALVAGLSPEDWRWRPADGGWSLVEIVNHLADEEVSDFRTRVRSTLEDASRPWPSMDPEAWVKERRYQERDPAESVQRFLDERAASLAWLRCLSSPNWDATYAHPRGALRAGDLLASWAAHDARHVQQIAKRFHGLAARDGAPYSVGYAG
jgi:hypothetical protein